jgi:signal transduction histidine kinase
MAETGPETREEQAPGANATGLAPAILALPIEQARPDDLAASDALRKLQLTSNQLLRAANELQRTNRFQSMILDNISQGVVVFDEYSQLEAWNEVFLSLYGLTKKSLQKGMHIADFSALFGSSPDLPLSDAAKSCNRRLDLLEPGQYYDRLGNGTAIDISIATRDAGGLIATYTDVTGHVDSQARLKAQGVQLALQIEELQRLGHSLEQARNQAIKSDQEKSRFLAMISHDIRTPMSAVISTLELLSDDTAMFDRDRLLKVALNSGRQMLYLLADIIEISRTDGWDFAIQDEDTPLGALLESITDAWRPLARKKGLTLDLQLAGDLPAACRTDPKRLRQVVDNLVSNAIKFTQTGGVGVVADCHAVGGHQMIRIAVRDTGRGIDAAMQHALFQEFGRIENKADQAIEGTGLGLSIARRIVESMGGTLGVESQQGMGSVFILQIPNVPVEKAIAPDNTSRRPLSLVTRTGTVPHILIADDYASNRIILAEILGLHGCTSVEAVDGPDALALFADGQVDAILMDGFMPGLDGAEVTRRIRMTTSGQKSVPIIGVTASTGTEERDALIAAGMDDVLTKPLDANALIQTLRRLLA